VLWHWWLGHLTHKIIPEMTYMCNVSSWTLNPTILIFIPDEHVCSVVECVDEQSAWRGHRLRRQLQCALKFVQFASDVDLSLPDFDVNALLSKASWFASVVCYFYNSNNNINSKTMFMLLSSWQSHCESSLGSFDECRMASSGRRPKTKPNDMGCESTCTGCQSLHPPSPFIIITQLESWHSLYHPTEGRRLSQPSWLVTYPHTVTHPGTNRVRRSATTLIEASALPLSQTAKPSMMLYCEYLRAVDSVDVAAVLSWLHIHVCNAAVEIIIVFCLSVIAHEMDECTVWLKLCVFYAGWTDRWLDVAWNTAVCPSVSFRCYHVTYLSNCV